MDTKKKPDPDEVLNELLVKLMSVTTGTLTGSESLLSSRVVSSGYDCEDQGWSQ